MEYVSSLPVRKRRRRRRRRRTGLRLLPLAAVLLLVCLWWPQQTEKTPQEESGSMSASTEDELQSRLEALAGEEPRAKPLLEGDWPEELLELVLRNRETLDFVLEWHEGLLRSAAERVEGVEKGTFPLLMQWDPGWGYKTYGDGPMALTGCGPTVLSMAICGLTGKDDVTPYVVAQYAQKEGFYVEGTGTSWDLMRLGGEDFGVKAEEIPLSESQVLGALRRGEPVVCSVGPGDFTTSGHFILLVGEEDGRIRLHDPNRRANSELLWDFQTLAPQIRNLWSFSELE